MATEYGPRAAGTGEFPAVPAPRPRPAEKRGGGAGPPGWPAGPSRASRLLLPAAMPAADAAALVAAAFLAGRPGLASAVYAAAAAVILTACGQHRLRICLRVADQAGRFLTAAALPLLLVAWWMPAGQAVRAALWSFGLIMVARLAVSAGLRAAHRRGRLTEPALVIGAGTFGAHIGEVMRERPELGLRPQGYLDHGPPRRDLALPSLGTPDDLAEVVTSHGIRRVIVCWAACKDEDLVTVLRAARPLAADICVIPRLYELGAAVPRAYLDDIWGIPLIPLRRLGHSRAGQYLKRVFDVAVAGTLLIAAAPVLLALAVAVRVVTGQSPLFRQVRVTGQDRTASIMKLRTLTDHPNPDTSWTVTAQECSTLGRWLRVTHLDELPQLVNVLRGDMSLVGPRPERPYFVEQFGREIHRYSDRTRMPAGMTGWAQVHGLHGDTSIFERARFDNQYIEYWSPWLDVVILARTLAASFFSRQGGGR